MYMRGGKSLTQRARRTQRVLAAGRIPADCQSAIQQAASLRYDATGRAAAQAGNIQHSTFNAEHSSITNSKP